MLFAIFFLTVTRAVIAIGMNGLSLRQFLALEIVDKMSHSLFLPTGFHDSLDHLLLWCLFGWHPVTFKPSVL